MYSAKWEAFLIARAMAQRAWKLGEGLNSETSLDTSVIIAIHHGDFSMGGTSLAQSDYRTDANISLLRILLPTLSRQARIAIQLRFWENLTIQEIAGLLEVSWDQADRLIEDSIQQLRDGFEKFSRAQNVPVAS